jgi:hydrogenase nickel incorporation protein HypB
MKVQVLQNILEFNDTLADQNRSMFDAKKVFVINLMSSPGAGKTTLLERTLKEGVLRDYRVGVIEGDIQTTLDGERLEALKVPVVQINTAVACHLDGQMISNACSALDLENLDILFIENVGNLVCPAEFRVGEHQKVVLLSVPEGADKPLKYPLMFHESSLLLITKTDMLPYTDISVDTVRRNARRVNDTIDIIELSAKTGEGVTQWGEWIKAKRKAHFGS